jgi:response regulator RpfG family c-di-GMP phosphodiesterase
MTESQSTQHSWPQSSEMEARPVVLCVDDEPHILEGMRDVLRRTFDVRTASGGVEGLEMLRADPGTFALVISDMRMPVMTGDAFLREARIAAPDAVRILLTGHADMDAAVRAVNHAHLFRFLTKPCAAEELLRACAAGVGQHRLLTAERVLLEQTLRGSIDALAGTLALANPAAFGRGVRLKELVSGLADAAGLASRWEVEVAAMLAHIGAVTLPQPTAEKLYAGEPLNPAEQVMVDRIPEVTRRLLAKIPRLEGVLAILASYAQELEPGDPASLELLSEGARALRIVTDYDELESEGVAPEVALGTMSTRRIYDRSLLDALAGVVGVGNRAPAVMEIALAALECGTTLADDVRTSNGGLLVARGQAVTPQMIERLANIGEDGIRQPLRVFEG